MSNKAKGPLPVDFVVPVVLDTDRFRLRMLSVTDVEKDYEAVMSSKEHLRTVFASQDTWPADNMTIEDNLADLQWHQDEFMKRSSFAYTVMTPDESLCLGCVYIYPSNFPGYDAHSYLWVRADQLADGLDAVLFHVVKDWLAEKWPFAKVAFPGREISWEAWKVMKAHRPSPSDSLL